MISRSMCLMALVTIIAGCRTAPESIGLSAEDEAAIRARFAEFADAERAGDWDAVLGMMTDDVVLLPNEQPAIQGRSALQQWMAQFPGLTFEELTVTVEAVEGRGDLAVVWGRYYESYRLEAMDEILEEAGKFVWALRRQADGSWGLAIGIANADQIPSDSGDEM